MHCTGTWTSWPFYDPSLEGRNEIVDSAERRDSRRSLDELWKAIYILPLIFYLLLLMFSLGASPLPPLPPLYTLHFVFYLRMHELWIFPYGMRLACIQREPQPEPEPQKMMRRNLLSLLNFLEIY